MSRFIRAVAVASSLIWTSLGFAQSATVTSLATSAAGAPVSSVGAGTAITLTATVVVGTSPANVGQVNFCDADAKFCMDIHLIATSQVTASGTATYKFIPGIGTHHYKAVFLGTRTAQSSTSTTATLTVTAPTSSNSPTTTVVTPTGHPGDYTLTATVNTTLMAPPTGSVSFFDITNANYPLGTATLSPGVGSLNLQQKSSIDPGGTPVIADFNGDGIPDLALPDGIHLGKGDGTFTAIGSVRSAVLSADFNNDGKADLVVLGSTTTIFLGNGDGTFKIAPGTLSGGVAVVAGDVNHDGNEDLVVTNGGQIVTYLGHGNGTFTAVAQAASVTAGSIFIADFNQDGKLDLAAINADDPNLNILIGNGDGTFIVDTPIDVFGTEKLLTTANLVIADFNGDGIPDIIVITSFRPNPILILFGQGDGLFSKPTTVETDYYVFIAAADFNNDGIVDVAVMYPAGDFDPTSIAILYGNGDGTFHLGPTAIDPGQPQSEVIADLNGDGYPDIATLELNGSTSIFLLNFTATSTAALPGVNVVGTGTHYVDAQYTGDSSYIGSLSPPVPITADTVPVSLALTAAPPDGIIVGNPLAITASLSPFTAQNHDATGIVTFTDATDGTTLGTATISNGTATVTTSALPAGMDDLVATYPGDINFRPSTARDLVYTVFPLKSQTITFAQPVSPTSILSVPITLVATASSGLPVTFKLVSGPATLTGSVLTLTGLGTVIVAADQRGDSTYSAAPEVTRTILVTPPASVGLNATPTLTFLLSPVTLTAAISPYGSLATGTVTFLDGTTPIGTAAPQGGTATISLSNLPLGPHTITAMWSGDAGYIATSSPGTDLIVEDFSIAFADPQVTIIHGGTATFTLRLTPVGGPAMAAPIGVSLSGEPTGSEMTVAPGSIATGASTGTVTVVIATPNYPTGPFARNNGGEPHGTSKVFFALIVFGGLLLPFGRRAAKLRTRSLWNSALLVIASATLILGSIGCGAGWSTEIFQIQATATSGILSHTTTATLTSKCSNGQPACPVVGK